MAIVLDSSAILTGWKLAIRERWIWNCWFHETIFVKRKLRKFCLNNNRYVVFFYSYAISNCVAIDTDTSPWWQRWAIIVNGYHEQYSSVVDVEFRHNTQKIKRGC